MYVSFLVQVDENICIDIGSHSLAFYENGIINCPRVSQSSDRITGY